MAPSQRQTLNFSAPAIIPPSLPGQSNTTSFNLGAVADLPVGIPELSNQNNASAPRPDLDRFGS